MCFLFTNLPNAFMAGKLSPGISFGARSTAGILHPRGWGRRALHVGLSRTGNGPVPRPCRLATLFRHVQCGRWANRWQKRIWLALLALLCSPDAAAPDPRLTPARQKCSPWLLLGLESGIWVWVQGQGRCRGRGRQTAEPWSVSWTCALCWQPLDSPAQASAALLACLAWQVRSWTGVLDWQGLGGSSQTGSGHCFGWARFGKKCPVSGASFGQVLKLGWAETF